MNSFPAVHNITVEEIGVSAQFYVAHPDQLPKNCPDPRVNAQGFSDYMRQHPGALRK